MLRKIRLKVLIAGILLFALGQSGLAPLLVSTGLAEEEVPAYELGEIVITPTKTEKVIKDVPASVTVVTSEEIEQSSTQNVDDSLREKANITVQRNSGIATTVPISVHMRGISGANRVAVLLDGMPLNSGLHGFVNWNVVPKDAVDRVEVVRGPFSSLYGTNAMAGVINVVTRRPQTGFNTSIRTNGGNYRLLDYGLNHSWSGERFNYLLTVERQQTDNYLVRDFVIERTYDSTSGRFSTKQEEAVNLDYDQLNLFTKLGLKVNSSSNLTFSGGYFQSEAGMGKTEYLYTSGLDEMDKKAKKEEYHLNLSARTVLGEKYNFSFNVYNHHPSEKYWGENYGGMTPGPFPPPHPYYVPTLMTYESSDYGAEVKMARGFGEKHLFTTGIDGRINNGKWTVVNTDTGEDVSEGMDKTATTVALYVQDEMGLLEPLDITLGGRLDYHSKFGSAFSPKMGILWRATERTRVRSSVGQAFNAPTLGQLYQPDWMRRPGTTLRANPDLEPEKVLSYDLGLEQEFSDSLIGKMTLFRNDCRDLIALQTKGNIEQYENIEKTYSQGIETELDALLFEGLTAYFNYVYLDAKDKDTDETLEYTPHNRVNLGMRFSQTFRNIGLRIAPLVRYTDKQHYTDRSGIKYELSPYWVCDLTLSIDLPRYVELVAAVKNLTNEKYEDYGGTLAPGRNYWFGTRIKF